MLGIEREISVFLQALLSGSIVFLIYCCIRIVRRLIKHNLFFVSMEDFFFWIGTGLYLFAEIYRTSDGSIRWFFVVGVAAGILIFYGMSRVAKKVYKKFLGKRLINK